VAERHGLSLASQSRSCVNWRRVRIRLTAPFRRIKSLQKFANVHASFHNHFTLERHLVNRQTYKERRSAAWSEWQNVMA
jgi:putative transposase